MQFCAPSRLYFSTAIFVAILLLFAQVPLITISLMLLFAYFWAVFLDFLCGKGYKNISWLLVLLPYAMKILTYIKFDAFK